MSLTLPPELVAVLDALPDGHGLYVAERTTDGSVGALRSIYMNPAGLALRGMTFEDFSGTDLLERTRKLGNDLVADGYVAAMNAGEALHRTLVSDDLVGPRTFEVTASRLQLGEHEVLSMWFRDVTQELRSRRRLQRAVEMSAAHSRTDDLTGLLNRRGWRAAADAAFSQDVLSVSVAIADLDHFKDFNDRFGHAAGDDLLRRLSAAWQQLLEPGQALARLGGEEFALLFPGMEAPEAAEALARFSEAVPEEQTVSIGVAARRGSEVSGDVLARADEALYVAKRGGRARVVVAP